jgi:C-terminal processing protease CtpA/Prc
VKGGAILSQEAITYLNEALDILERHSVKRNIIDWDALRSELLAGAESAQTTAETYPLIRKALASLGDHHSFFLAPDEVSRFEEGAFKNVGLLAVYPEGTIVQVYEGGPAAQAGVQAGDQLETINHVPVPLLGAEAFKDALQESSSVLLTLRRKYHPQPYTMTLEAVRYPIVAIPQGRLLAQSIGYLDLPGIVGSDEMLYAYTATLQNRIRDLDQAPLRGWVVDLRRNTGGNMISMLAGLGPILGEGELGAFVDPAGTTMIWSYHDGQIRIGEWAGIKYDNPYLPKHAHVPIAVLSSRLTTSSGELVLLAFRGRPQTRVFGEETAGVPTANKGIQLSDGAIIQLTIALGADRTGRTYDGPLTPDEFVEADWTQFGIDSDPVLTAAIDWLLETPQ